MFKLLLKTFIARTAHTISLKLREVAISESLKALSVKREAVTAHKQTKQALQRKLASELKLAEDAYIDKVRLLQKLKEDSCGKCDDSIKKLNDMYTSTIAINTEK